MYAYEVLRPGMMLRTFDGNNTLELLSGNLVLTSNRMGRPTVWATNTTGSGANALVMQVGRFLGFLGCTPGALVGCATPWLPTSTSPGALFNVTAFFLCLNACQL